MSRAAQSRMLATVVAICALALVLDGCTSGSSAPPGVGHSGSSVSSAARTLTSGGVQRSYRLYVPPKAAGSGSVPLLVALHGGGGSGAHFEQISGFDKIAESAGFIVVYPDGTRPATGGRVSTWNAGDCCGTAARTHVDDVGFIHTLIDTVSAEHHIDLRRVFVTGFSNGGMLA